MGGKGQKSRLFFVEMFKIGTKICKKRIKISCFWIKLQILAIFPLHLIK